MGMLPIFNEIAEEEVVYPLSSDISDYSTPNGASASGNSELPSDESDDFSSYENNTEMANAYPQNGADIIEDASNDKLRVLQNDTDYDTVIKDLEALLGEAVEDDFTLRFVINLKEATYNGVAQAILFFGVTSEDETSNFDNLQDGMGAFFLVSSGGSSLRVTSIDNQALTGNSNTMSGANLTEDIIRGYEIIKNGTTVTLKQYTDDTFTSVIDTESRNINSPENLRYLKIATSADSTTVIDVEILSWQFWNGITTISPNASVTKDNDTATKHITNKQANPFNQIDMTGSVDSRPVAVAVYPDKANMTETTLLIQTSKNGSDFVDKASIAVKNLNDLAWNFFKLNVDNEDMRYVRIKGNSGESKKLSFREIKYRTVTGTELAQVHGHEVVL